MRRARHIYFKAYPGSWIIEAVMKSQAKITSLHYGRGTESTQITPAMIREHLKPAYEKLAQALNIYHSTDIFKDSDLYGLNVSHNLITGQLVVSLEHRITVSSQKYHIEFIQAAGNWNLIDRCLMEYTGDIVEKKRKIHEML